ncbi:hypothetical protein KS2013_1070 [Kangiella sediminilitoris]|uniref:Uncharacterized protein n=2 Tax=Kangiella sediminilitoris TaxID=1144748 RepID=A0A1B3BAG2_9GAMM|nr:hypothetical protein KS2013_1070 [Kangiella sediminilitoris]
MDVRDLKPGDVLLFSPEEGSWISKAITWLTDAPVSHAAMTYQLPTKLVEETPPAVRIADATLRFVDRTVHVMRLNKPVDDFKPVMDVAAKYLNGQAPYSMNNLYLLGILLLYKKFTPNDETQKIILKILKSLTERLLDAINQMKYPDKHPMVCSQFVFECYLEAGKAYRLSIKDGVLKSDSPRPNLITKAFKHTRKNSQLANLSAGAESDDEQLAKQLYHAMNDETLLASGVVSDELLDSIHDFAQTLHAVSQELELAKADPRQGLAILQAQSSMFVTPGDLLRHCPELRHVGDISLK